MKPLLNGLIVLALPMGLALFGAAPISANPSMCRLQRGGEADKLVPCKVQSSAGRVVAIQDLLDGGAFRLGQDGWLAVKNQPCLFNAESGSHFCVVNRPVKK